MGAVRERPGGWAGGGGVGSGVGSEREARGLVGGLLGGGGDEGGATEVVGSVSLWGAPCGAGPGPGLRAVRWYRCRCRCRYRYRVQGSCHENLFQPVIFNGAKHLYTMRGVSVPGREAGAVCVQAGQRTHLFVAREGSVGVPGCEPIQGRGRTSRRANKRTWWDTMDGWCAWM